MGMQAVFVVVSLVVVGVVSGVYGSVELKKGVYSDDAIVTVYVNASAPLVSECGGVSTPCQTFLQALEAAQAISMANATISVGLSLAAGNYQFTPLANVSVTNVSFIAGSGEATATVVAIAIEDSSLLFAESVIISNVTFQASFNSLTTPLPPIVFNNSLGCSNVDFEVSQQASLASTFFQIKNSLQINSSSISYNSLTSGIFQINGSAHGSTTQLNSVAITGVGYPANINFSLIAAKTPIISISDLQLNGVQIPILQSGFETTSFSISSVQLISTSLDFTIFGPCVVSISNIYPPAGSTFNFTIQVSGFFMYNVEIPPGSANTVYMNSEYSQILASDVVFAGDTLQFLPANNSMTAFPIISLVNSNFTNSVTPIQFLFTDANPAIIYLFNCTIQGSTQPFVFTYSTAIFNLTQFIQNPFSATASSLCDSQGYFYYQGAIKAYDSTIKLFNTTFVNNTSPITGFLQCCGDFPSRLTIDNQPQPIDQQDCPADDSDYGSGSCENCTRDKLIIGGIAAVLVLVLAGGSFILYRRGKRHYQGSLLEESGPDA